MVQLVEALRYKGKAVGLIPDGVIRILYLILLRALCP